MFKFMHIAHFLHFSSVHSVFIVNDNAQKFQIHAMQISIAYYERRFILSN